MKESDLDFIYNIVCPVCGSKPTYQVTGINSDGLITNYIQNKCGHEALEKIIQDRENKVIRPLN